MDTVVLRSEIFEINNQIDFNKGGEDLTRMLKNQLDGKLDSWSIRWGYTISKNNGLCISPINSYVSLIFDEGTHVKSYIKSFDNNLVLSKKLITYPKNIEVVTEIARAAAKVYNHKTPLLLKEDIEQKPFL